MVEGEGGAGGNRAGRGGFFSGGWRSLFGGKKPAPEAPAGGKAGPDAGSANTLGRLFDVFSR